MKNKALELYLIEAKKHQKQYLSELDELRKDLLNDHFSQRDYRATERVLQVFTELCIGLSKHWLKTLQSDSTSDAYKTFSILKENALITTDELIKWRKIIGLRNGLVHDYLNIDPIIIENIVRKNHYIQMAEFSNKAIVALLSS